MIILQDFTTSDLKNFYNEMLINKQWNKELSVATHTLSRDNVKITTYEINLKDVANELLKRSYDEGVKLAVDSRFDDYQKHMLRMAYEIGKRGEPFESITEF